MAPSPNGSNGTGRGTGGRFAQGNSGGPGNPYARRVAALRTALLDALTDEDIRALVKSLVGQATQGDVPSAKLILAYTVGPPLGPVEPDRLEEHEFSVERGKPTPAERSLAELLR